MFKLLLALWLQTAQADKPDKHCSDLAPRFQNHQNVAFYDASPPDYLANHSGLKGLSNGEDLEQIRKDLDRRLDSPDSLVIEIGAGTGRVLDWLQKFKPNLKIVAYEPSKTNIERIQTINPNLQIIHGSILEETLPSNVRVAFWMWSGSLEFNSQERKKVLGQVYEALDSDGLFVLDTPRLILGEVNLTQSEDGFVEQTLSFGTLRGQLFSETSLTMLATELGFRVEKREYLTSSQMPRTIFLLTKPATQ